MENTKVGHTPGPVDIVKVMAEDAYRNALEETIESAGAELDWSDISDNDREKAEIGAAVLMLSAPKLLAALEMIAEAGIDFQAGKRDIGTIGILSGCLNNAREAIAKATGK